MGKLFGTDGIRGIANEDLSPELAFRTGKASAVLLKNKLGRTPYFIIGKDTRVSGDMLEMALVAGFLAAGAKVMSVGVLPTPAVAFFVKKYKADAGAVISASHNPYEYNGIKFFNHEGFKLDDQLEVAIEELILADGPIETEKETRNIGKYSILETADNEYAKYLKATVNEPIDQYKVVIDCANGAAYKVAEQVLTQLGVAYIAVNTQPNGTNINVDCGSLHPKKLQDLVVEHKADLGLAYDGDADRLIAVDEKGQIVDGDQIIYVCARMLKEMNQLNNDIAVATVMSNIGFHKAIGDLGASVEVTDVGDRYVVERMRKKGATIGGEQSGHIIFMNHSSTGDGILAGLQLIQAIKILNKPLSALANEVTIYPQVLVNAHVKKDLKKRYMENEFIAKKIAKLEDEMAGEGRVLIRPSGTEPLVRVMIEGKNQEDIQIKAEELAKLIEQEIG